ncbi:hypothetical protein ACOSP7_015726 [Xanthoceras sorbifolium]
MGLSVHFEFGFERVFSFSFFILKLYLKLKKTCVALYWLDFYCLYRYSFLNTICLIDRRCIGWFSVVGQIDNFQNSIRFLSLLFQSPFLLRFNLYVVVRLFPNQSIEEHVVVIC